METTNQKITDIVESHFAPAEIAERLNLSEQTAIRLFQDQPGVLNVRKGLGKKRNYVTLRIPESVVRRVLGNKSS
jgi:CTP-dependent riboflavin kinase